jgi:putative ABC transport system substrate-binding protein
LQRALVIEFAAKQRLPAIYTAPQPVLEGGLMSYTADFGALSRRTAAIMDRILKGAKPAEIPVEQPTKFELAINVKTANAAGFKIPQSVLIRADRVID